MADYQQFCAVASSFGAEQLNPDVWRFELPGRDAERTQDVFVMRELMPPDLEFLQIKSAFAPLEETDCAQVLRHFGQMTVASIGHNPLYDDQGNQEDGLLTLASSLPLAVLDLTNPLAFMLYLHVLARAADGLEQQLRGGDAF